MSWYGSKQSGHHGGGDIGHRSGARYPGDRTHGERHGNGDSQDRPRPSFNWGRSGHGTKRGENDPIGMIGGTANGKASTPRTASKLAIAAAIAALIFWSLLAGGAYALVEVAGGWLSANGGALLQGGKDVAGAVGVGKDIVDKVDIQSSAELLQQLVGAALMVARPTIVFLWLLGSLAILTAPFVATRLGRFVRSRH